MVGLRNILLLQRDLPRAVAFYRDGLGLKVSVFTENWAELETGGTVLALQAVDGYSAIPEQVSLGVVSQNACLFSEAFCTTGYSPVLNFNVEDLQGTLNELLKRGAIMDGPIQYPIQGQVNLVCICFTLAGCTDCSSQGAGRTHDISV